MKKNSCKNPPASSKPNQFEKPNGDTSMLRDVRHSQFNSIQFARSLTRGSLSPHPNIKNTHGLYVASTSGRVQPRDLGLSAPPACRLAVQLVRVNNTSLSVIRFTDIHTYPIRANFAFISQSHSTTGRITFASLRSAPLALSSSLLDRLLQFSKKEIDTTN